jgi:hypothetical protein
MQLRGNIFNKSNISWKFSMVKELYFSFFRLEKNPAVLSGAILKSFYLAKIRLFEYV